MSKGIIRLAHLLYRLLPSTGAALADLGICAMVILVVINALLRYGFGSSPKWGDEICAFLIVFVVFVGAGCTFLQERHVRITVVVSKLPPRVITFLEAISGLITMAYVGYLIYSTAELTLMSYNLGSTTPSGLSLYLLQMWIPIGLIIFYIPVTGFTVTRVMRILLPSRYGRDHGP